ncbi:MAG: hypothetical protein Q4F65_14355, partial [Propionibacteriaceae bacterium]|nr:hypothetical protein [Propionibacteriaceae bacterium]
LAADIDRLTAGGATLVLVQTDRPGIGLTTRCTPEHCHEFLQRLWHRDDLRIRWNAILTEVAEADPRVETITIDDVYCRDEGVPCDDHLDTVSLEVSAAARGPATVNDTAGGPVSGTTIGPVDEETLARPDGSHFSDAAIPRVATSLLDRVTAATGH